MSKIYKALYYFLIVILFLSLYPIINFVRYSDKYIVENKIKDYENDSLKQEIKELSNINYDNYNYVLAKVIVKNLYNSQTIYYKTNEKVDNDLAIINNIGLIGVTNNNTIKLIKELNLSIKVNEKIGKLENNKVYLSDEVSNGDNVYTSDLSYIPYSLLVGKIDKCDYINDTYICSIIYNKIDTNYVAIIKGYNT